MNSSLAPFKTTEKIYEVLFSRASARKKKVWEHDGFLVYKFYEFFNGDDTCLTLVRKIESDKLPIFEEKGFLLCEREKEFAPGYQFSMCGYDMEIQELVKKKVKVNEAARQRPDDWDEHEESAGDSGETVDLEESENEGVQRNVESAPNPEFLALGVRQAQTGFVRPTLSMQIVPMPSSKELAQKKRRNNEPLRNRREEGYDYGEHFTFSGNQPQHQVKRISREPDYGSGGIGLSDFDFEIDYGDEVQESRPVHDFFLGGQLPVNLADHLGTRHDEDDQRAVQNEARDDEDESNPTSKDNEKMGIQSQNSSVDPTEQSREELDENLLDFVPASQVN